MNFRSCKYFLTVCEMGTINAAARKLYISPQSLSQHIRRLEEELDAQLFHRDNPLTLTDAGRSFKTAAADILSTMDRLQRELADLKGSAAQELTIGMLDYGTPDFIPPLLDLYLKQEPNVMIITREIPGGEPIPDDISLFISARELGSSFRCEILFSDRLSVCVSDQLLKKLYPEDWKLRKLRLEQGDLHALERCPFVMHRNTPLEALSDLVFTQNDFVPTYLPVMGTPSVLSQLCAAGQAAMITFLKQAQTVITSAEPYILKGVPDAIPTGYICYRNDDTLSAAAQGFIALTRKYFKRS